MSKKHRLRPYMQCPHCKSDDLVCTSRARRPHHIVETYHCYGCCFEWTERYRLQLESIEEHPERIVKETT